MNRVKFESNLELYAEFFRKGYNMTGVQQTASCNEGVKVQPHLWIDAYADYLYSYAISRVKGEEMARDLVQDTFLAALEKADKFEGRSTEKTWLTAILKYKIVNLLRSRGGICAGTNTTETTRKENAFFQADGHWNIEDRPQPFGLDHIDKMEYKELQSVLLKCLQKLPALWIIIFTMKYIEEERADEICNQLKLSSANYWVIIHRAKINLRACLQKNWL